MGRIRNAAPLLVAALIVAVDQLTKTWVRTHPEGSVMFHGGLLRLTHVHNSGAAFGLFQGQSELFTGIGIAGIIIMLCVGAVALRRYPNLATGLHLTAFGLVLGGTAGNLADRLRFGRVTDFIDVGAWPAFNVADSALTIGALLIAYSILRSGVRERRPAG